MKKSRYKFVILSLSFFVLTVSGVHSFLNYHVVYAHKHESTFSPFPPELKPMIDKYEPQYEHVYFSNQHFSDAHIFLAFYQKIDPTEYQNTVVRPEPDAFGFSHPLQLGKYFFGEKKLTEFVCSNEENVLYITNDQEVSAEQTLETLYDFSHVHPQVKMIDVDRYREELRRQSLLSCEEK